MLRTVSCNCLTGDIAWWRQLSVLKQKCILNDIEHRVSNQRSAKNNVELDASVGVGITQLSAASKCIALGELLSAANKNLTAKACHVFVELDVRKITNCHDDEILYRSIHEWLDILLITDSHHGGTPGIRPQLRSKSRIRSNEDWALIKRAHGVSRSAPGLS